MSSFEIGYCSAGEYIRTKNDRLKEADLTIGGLYTVMFQLARLSSATESDRHKAARYPSRITRAEQVAADSWELTFNVLDPDLAPAEVDVQANTIDGYLLSVPASILHIDHYGVAAGYFREYSNGDDTEQDVQDFIIGRIPAQGQEVRRPARVPTKVH